MSSNYMFAFRRSAPVAPVAPVALKATAAPKAPVLSLSDRFSLNRLIHYKATGGCRSCS